MRRGWRRAGSLEKVLQARSKRRRPRVTEPFEGTVTNEIKHPRNAIVAATNLATDLPAKPQHWLSF